MSLPLLIVILGPTAVGKTELGVALAKRLDTEVVSADSRQLYKELHIGTAAPGTEEMQGVPHHFIASHTIHQPYTAGMYEKEALRLLQDIFGRRSAAVVVGGSGLYINALLYGLDEMENIVPGTRDALNDTVKLQGLSVLLYELQEKDPEYFKKVDKSNPQRIIRALEVIRSTGKPFSLYRKNKIQERPFRILQIGIELPRPELYGKINHRVEDMIKNGLLEEATSLYPYKDRNALQTVGYQEIFQYLEQACSWDHCVHLIKQNTRRYAKRQMTWFKKDASIHWTSPESMEEVFTRIQSYL